jgi:hypothetical protein
MKMQDIVSRLKNVDADKVKRMAEKAEANLAGLNEKFPDMTVATLKFKIAYLEAQLRDRDRLIAKLRGQV